MWHGNSNPYFVQNILNNLENLEISLINIYHEWLLPFIWKYMYAKSPNWSLFEKRDHLSQVYTFYLWDWFEICQNQRFELSMNLESGLSDQCYWIKRWTTCSVWGGCWILVTTFQLKQNKALFSATWCSISLSLTLCSIK